MKSCFVAQRFHCFGKQLNLLLHLFVFSVASAVTVVAFCGFGFCALCSKHNFDFADRDKRMLSFEALLHYFEACLSLGGQVGVEQTNEQNYSILLKI